MEIGFVGKEVAGWDVAHCVIPFELFDEQFDPGAIVVEPPEIERAQGKICDQNLIVVPAKFEERQLIGRFLGLEPSDHDEAVETGPMDRLIAKLGNLDAATGAAVPQMRQLAFDGCRQPGHDHETGPPPFEPLDQRVVVKPFVRADNHQSDTSRDLRKTRREQRARARRGMDIARPQFAVPEVLALALEAQQGMIGPPPTLEGIVANAGPLLFAIDHQDRGIDIEDQPRGAPRLTQHAAEQAIVQGPQPLQAARGNPQQEATERGRLGIAGQPSQVLKDAVLPQQLGGLDAFESEDHGIEHGQKQLANAVTIVALHKTDVLRKGMFEADAGEKPMEKIDATIVGECLRTKCNTQ